MKTIAVPLLACMVLLHCVSGGIALAEPVLDLSGKALRLSSEYLLFEPELGTALFSDNVRIEQSDAELKAQGVYVTFSGEAVAKTSFSVEQFEAFDRVSLQVPGKKATGDYARYTAQKNTVILVGNVVLKQGQTVLKGKSFTYRLDTGDAALNNTAPIKDYEHRLRVLFERKKALEKDSLAMGAQPDTVGFVHAKAPDIKTGAESGETRSAPVPIDKPDFRTR